MMIQVQADFSNLTKHMDSLQKKQIPFAASQAINDVAFMSTTKLKVDAQVYLDRPTPFTLRGFKVQKASKRNLVGYVYIDKIQEAYMKKQIEGAIISGTSAVPVDARLNKFGNIPNRKTGLIKNSNQFIGEFGGVRGVFERGRYNSKGKFTKTKTKRNVAIRLLVAFNKNVRYDKKFPFYQLTKQVVKKNISLSFSKRLRAALRTAR